MRPTGYFAVGIEYNKVEHNLASLWRAAGAMGASFIYTVGKAYNKQRVGDRSLEWLRIPLFHFKSFEDLKDHLPYGSPIVGVSQHSEANGIVDFIHPANCCYLLGLKDNSLSEEATNHCHMLVELSDLESMNVAEVGTIVMYDRLIKKKLVETLL